MDIHSVPMLISGILCSLLAIVTWLIRRHESINRFFCLFTLALALDAFAFFSWFQFGSVENIDIWMRVIVAAGFLVPTGLILFFFAFTGFDERLDEKVFGLKARNFRVLCFLFLVGCAFLSLFTDLVIGIPDTPEHVWDVEFGPVGYLLFCVFLGIFSYLFTMAYRSYRRTNDKPQRKFILLLTVGTFMWLLFGYGGLAVFPVSSEVWQSISYLGTAVMATFYFVAIVKYQSDRALELNTSLERKVEERTRHLQETRSQLIQSERMAALGHLVAGVAHEMNTPVGAVHGTHGTLVAATEKLTRSLEDDHDIRISETRRLSSILKAIADVGDVIRDSSERITGVVKRLRVFARLDEADLQSVDFNECVENTLAMFRFHLKPGIEIRTELADLPKVTCYPAKINQLCFQLLRNANRAIDESGEVVLRTEVQGEEISLSISDDGRGIPSAEMGRIFDPGYTGWDVKVGTGLGLAICFQVAQEHNGRIAAESVVGEGSTFTLRIPIDHARAT